MKVDREKILIVAANGLGKTGVPNVIYQVVSALIASFSIDVVVFNDENYYGQKIENLGARIIKVSEKEPNGILRRLFWRLFGEEQIIKSIFSNLFKKENYYAVHSFKEYDSAYIFKLAKKFNVKKRIIHCNNEIHKPHNLISRLFFMRKSRIVRRCITDLIGVSNECCTISYPKIQYKVLHNTYDERKYNSSIDCDLENDEFVLSQVATFSSRKNQLFTISVFSEVLKEYPTAVLNLVGTEVEKGYLQRIKNEVVKLGISDSVHFVDGSSDFSHIFNHSTFFLLPSLHEAAPISVVEVQACGITCFASDTITKDVDCGGVIYLSINDPVLWAREIIKQFKEKNNTRSSYNLERFSSQRFSRELLNIYGVE